MAGKVKTFKIHTLQDTQRFAQKLAPLLHPKDIILLRGDLGLGKTTLTRAIIHEIGLKDEEVPSPTFTLLQTYDTKCGPLYHFDFYRIRKPEEIYELGIEDAYSYGITLIEWGEKMGPLEPIKRALIIDMSMDKEERIFKVQSDNLSWQDRIQEL